MSIPVAFQAPIDVMNRALQRVGQTRIASLTEDSKACDEVTFCYDKLRVAEMRRNVWTFSIRMCALRPYNPPMPANTATGTPASLGTVMLTPTLWDVTKHYLQGSIVTWNTKVYFSRTANTGSQPDSVPADWAQYFGPKTVSPYTTSTTYYPGELVYVLTGTTPAVYLCLAQSLEVPGVIDAWVATTYYNKGDTVTGTDATVYQSLIDFNSNINPVGDAGVHWATTPVAGQPNTRQGQFWMKLDAAVTPINFVYPAGSGPAFQPETRNVFFLPHGFLREAPQNPKAGGTTFLGGPSGNQYDDWQFNGGFIITRQQNLIMLRFAADIADVTQMDSMFCEGLACRVAGEVCEPLTQSTAKLQAIGAMYKQFMGDARAVNGIEQGPVEAPEDEFISCRI